MKEKKISSFSRLMEFAKNYKSFTYISLVLSAVSSVLALLPFYYIWKIIKEVLDVMPNFQNATGIVENGVLAVAFALLSMLIYIAALLCSHTSAFRVQANMRKQMMHKIVTLSLGEIEKIGSGKLRKTVNDCSSATETYLAHQLPDMVGSIVTPIGLLMFLLAFDWHFGLISLIPIVLSFVVMMVFMTGKTLQTKMEEYQNALDNMSNEAVEYVKERKQFGRPIAAFQTTQFKLADMQTKIDAARLLTWRAACIKDAGENYGPAAAMAKLFASDVANQVCREAVQLMGGYGYCREYPVERALRDAKITEIYEGTSEVQRMVISGNLLK